MGKSKKKLALIYEAAETNKAAHLAAFLKEDTNIRCVKFTDQWEPLHVAAQAGAFDSVETLLNWGANPNVADSQGCTPLHLAAAKGHADCVRVLIDHGAEPWLADSNNNTVLHYAIKSLANTPQNGKKLLHLLTKYKKYEPRSWETLMRTKNHLDLTPIELAVDLRLSKDLLDFLTSIEPPKEEHVITVLLHGWNDTISDWKIIEKNFENELQQMVYLFAYNSLANRVSIPSLASELRTFINEKRDFYITQKNKVSFQQFASSGENKLVVNVNIICYSTGGLIVRTFLNKWYQTEYRDIIERVVMVAPANFGSPFAKFGKSSVGKMYVGQKKVGSLFECGEELLTSLEPSSPFIWDLAHEDSLCPSEHQHFLPNKIMATIIQGTQHYEKNLQSKVTRGDMKGTDGTVTISGASMRCIKYSMNLSGGGTKETAIIQRSTNQVAARLHPSHTHRSITTSLVEMSDVFSLVKRALEATREQFLEMEKSFTKQNSVVYSKVHTPGNLLIFQYEGNQKPSIIPVLLYHKQEYIPVVGEAIDNKIMQIESRGNIVGGVRSQFSYTEYHSRSRNMFYKIVDLAMVANIMISIASELPGCAISLAIALKGHTQDARIIGSTSWYTTQGDCFLTSELSTTHLFCISPLPSESETQSDRILSLPSTSSLQLIEDDEDIDDSLRQLRSFGILGLCRSFHEKGKLEAFVEIICRKRADDLTGHTRAYVICALAPFFETCTIAQEGAANLLITTSWQMLDVIKSELSSELSSLIGEYSDLPSSKECSSLYQLTTKLLQIVPVKFFKSNDSGIVKRYIAETASARVIHLTKLVTDHIHSISSLHTRASQIKKSTKIICAMNAIISCKNEYYSDYTIFPGSQEFLCRICDNIDNSVIILRPANSKSALPTTFPVEEIEYEEETIPCIQEVVDDYMRLFPEYKFCLVFPNNPVFKEVAKIAQRITKSTQVFLKVDNENVNLHSSEIFGSFVFASCLAFDKKLIDAKSVLCVVRKSVEELQSLLFKKNAFNPSVRWQDMRADIRAAHMRVSVHCEEASSKWILGELEDLQIFCKRNQAALWLSSAGADMLLGFRDWVLAQDAGGNRVSPEGGNPFIDLCRCDIHKFNDFRAMLVDDVKASNKSNRRNLPVAPPRVVRPRSVPVKEKSSPTISRTTRGRGGLASGPPPKRLSRNTEGSVSPRNIIPQALISKPRPRTGGNYMLPHSQPIVRPIRGRGAIKSIHNP